MASYRLQRLTIHFLVSSKELTMHRCQLSVSINLPAKHSTMFLLNTIYNSYHFKCIYTRTVHSQVEAGTGGAHIVEESQIS